MVRLRDQPAGDMGNKQAKQQEQQLSNGHGNAVVMDELSHDFQDETLDTSNESIHVDDEITINIRPDKSPRKTDHQPERNPNKAATPGRTKVNGHQRGRPPKSPKSQSNGIVNGGHNSADNPAKSPKTPRRQMNGSPKDAKRSKSPKTPRSPKVPKSATKCSPKRSVQPKSPKSPSNGLVNGAHDSDTTTSRSPKTPKGEINGSTEGLISKPFSEIISVCTRLRSPKTDKPENEFGSHSISSDSSVRNNSAESDIAEATAEIFDETKTDPITKSPKDKHLKPERWKFKTRKKRRREEAELGGGEDVSKLPKTDHVQLYNEMSQGTTNNQMLCLFQIIFQCLEYLVHGYAFQFI